MAKRKILDAILNPEDKVENLLRLFFGSLCIGAGLSIAIPAAIQAYKIYKKMKKEGKL